MLKRRRKPEAVLEPDLARDTARLATAMEKLNRHNFIKLHNSKARMIWFQFLRGLAFGLGTVVGASALVSVALLVLSQFEVIPVIGGWATQIIQEIEAKIEQ